MCPFQESKRILAQSIKALAQHAARVSSFDPRWFNVTVGRFHFRHQRFTLFEVFTRHTRDGEHWWGFGILQIGKRWLFYIGYNSASILFIGQSA